MARFGEVSEFLNFVHEGTGVEHDNTQSSFFVLSAGLGARIWIINGPFHR